MRDIASELRRRPAVAAAVLFMLGIFAHRALPAWPIAWLVAIGACVGMVWVARRNETVILPALVAAVFLAGLVAAQIEAFYYPRDHISAFAGDEPRLANLQMQIIQPPRVLTGAFASHRPLPPKQVTTARVTKVRTWRGWEDACGDVLVQIAQPNPRLALGQTVRVLGMLERPGPAMNPGQFDWANCAVADAAVVVRAAFWARTVGIFAPPTRKLSGYRRGRGRRCAGVAAASLSVNANVPFPSRARTSSGQQQRTAHQREADPGLGDRCGKAAPVLRAWSVHRCGQAEV